MKHFNHISDEEKEKIFFKQPQEFHKNSPKKILSKALGATLYTPSIKKDIANMLINKKYDSLTSLVIDFEDSVGEHEFEMAEENIIKQFELINKAIEEGIITQLDLPLLFVRVKNVIQFKKFETNISKLNLITGFVFPKFSTINAMEYLITLQTINIRNSSNYYCMPILESKEVIYSDTAIKELTRLKGICDMFRDNILNIRIGGTDFSSLYSLRRSIDTTIYDILVVRSAISNIINTFGRSDNYYVISGVVWEYFPNHTRILKPTLRESIFFKEKGNEGKIERKAMIDDAIDGLIREIILDKDNGICGKTIIHPSHIKYVNGLQAISKEEYEDALEIVNNTGGGVKKSLSSNKMNEMRPHLTWAQKTLQLAEIYGVLNESKNRNALF